jgi:hypothetical protein
LTLFEEIRYLPPLEPGVLIPYTIELDPVFVDVRFDMTLLFIVWVEFGLFTNDQIPYIPLLVEFNREFDNVEKPMLLFSTVYVPELAEVV